MLTTGLSEQSDSRYFIHVNGTLNTDNSTKYEEQTTIQKFFSGKRVFITGVTGFLGSVLLEKLLRSCTEIDTIYVLIRGKRGEDVNDRLEKMLGTELFCQINPRVRRKIVPIRGDISLPHLGLSAESKEVLSKEVEIIFHVAASTNFGAHLRQAVSTNFLGTKRVIELSQNIKNLQVFVHVSTAYCNAIIRGKIREEVYPCWIDGNELIKILDNMTDLQIAENTTSLLGGQPNTYAFTKHLSENLLYKTRRNVPIAVVRPSVGTWEEPVPGWVENVQNGGVAFIAGAGKGIFRTVMGDHSKISDIVPCDMVANLTISAAWDVVNEGEGTFKVYHCTSGLENPVTLDSYCRLTIAKVKEFPCKEVLCVISYQQKFMRGASFIYFFSKRNWYFDTTNTRALAQKMSPKDEIIFNFDVSKIHWPTYIERCVLGVRQYYHRDSPKTLDKARTTLKMLRLIHYATYGVSCLVILYLLLLLGFGMWFSLLGAASALTFLIWF